MIKVNASTGDEYCEWVVCAVCGTEVAFNNIGTQSVQELFYGDRSIRRTVHSNDLVKFFWVAMHSKNETGNL